MGNPKSVDVASKPGAILIGGGSDCVPAFEWHISNTMSGDFVVLRASGDDAYNEWIWDMSIEMGQPLNSVTTVLFTSAEGAQNEEALQILREADGIFFAGGDQSLYINWWVGTEVQSIIQAKIPNVTIGGTSAGLAILGNYIFSAEYDTIESFEALMDPYDKRITLAPAFLKIPFLDSILTDSHFATRDRMGRMLTFLARELQDGKADLPLRGVGVDEETALLLDTHSGDVTVVGNSVAYVCTPSHVPESCVEKTPITFQDISCLRLNGTAVDTFSFKSFSFSGSSQVAYINSIVHGAFTALYPEQYGPDMPMPDRTDDKI